MATPQWGNDRRTNVLLSRCAMQLEISVANVKMYGVEVIHSASEADLF
jgi:hypothetical protein